ncbi:MAG TPA: hypothetical protein VGP72_24380 [Planctomycetota bacterium]|jgi:hypothetical protein
MVKRIAILICAYLCSSLAVCLAGEPNVKLPPIKEEELRRVERAPGGIFPWKKNPIAKPTVPTANTGDEGPQDMMSGEIIIKSFGDFSRVEQDGKEVLTLNKDVEIEQLQQESVLRGQTIKVVRDMKTGQAELLEAHGNVEVVTAERKGKGASLTYKTTFGPQGQITQDLYTIEGDKAKGIRATLWQGEDAIEADKFVNDRRLDTFRVTGSPAAIITLPPDATPAPAQKNSGGGMMPGLSFTGGSKVRMRADGEMFYEGASGRVRITRNVKLQQDGATPDSAMLMSGDEALLTMMPAPAGQPAANTSVFAGTLKTLDITGRVEIKAGTRTVLCDRAVLDMAKNIFRMEMKNPKEEVRVYMKDTGMLMYAPKNLTVHRDTGSFDAGGPQRMESFTGTPPTNRPPDAQSQK